MYIRLLITEIFLAYMAHPVGGVMVLNCSVVSVFYPMLGITASGGYCTAVAHLDLIFNRTCWACLLSKASFLTEARVSVHAHWGAVVCFVWLHSHVGVFDRLHGSEYCIALSYAWQQLLRCLSQ